MGGGLMQLVAYGAQDIYLTGNPQITFFKVVYRRHTNFSMEEIEQTANGTVGFGNTANYTISRNGDLVHKMYFEFDPNSLATNINGNVCPYVGNTLLKEVECEIGGQKIDKHYGHWLSTWADLTTKNPVYSTGHIDADGGTQPVVSNNHIPGTKYQRMSYNHHGAAVTTLSGAPKKAFVPLQFWFNRNPGLALPLIALQYHEVKIKITFAAQSGSGGIFSGLTTATETLGSTGKLWAQYIYLDTDERRRFAQVSHEYLIEQLQFQEQSSGNSTHTLNFNHPVKEIIWGGSPLQTASASSGPGILSRVKTTASGTADLRTTDSTWQLKLNGHDRFAPRHTLYFTKQQVYDHHTGCGAPIKEDAVHVYSFALKPEEHQPSGTCNFSRIDTAQLITNATGVANGDSSLGLHIYAVNYNVLRIMSGMGGLAYSN